jgi:hypothetical protein
VGVVVEGRDEGVDWRTSWTSRCRHMSRAGVCLVCLCSGCVLVWCERGAWLVGRQDPLDDDDYAAKRTQATLQEGQENAAWVSKPALCVSGVLC